MQFILQNTKFCVNLRIKLTETSVDISTIKHIHSFRWICCSLDNVLSNAIIVPTPLVGGEELYTQTGIFFVQSILADRYICRREKWVVSLKSCSSVEFKIKKIFWFSFFSRSYRGLKFCVNTGYLFTFSVIFLKIKTFSIKTVFQN